MIIDNIRGQPNIVGRKMISSHEYERLRQLLGERLSACGWKAQVTRLCRDVIYQSDVQLLTVDDLIDKVTPTARRLVPDSVKRELLHQIKTHLMEESGLLTGR